MVPLVFYLGMDLFSYEILLHLRAVGSKTLSFQVTKQHYFLSRAILFSLPSNRPKALGDLSNKGPLMIWSNCEVTVNERTQREVEQIKSL